MTDGPPPLPWALPPAATLPATVVPGPPPAPANEPAPGTTGALQVRAEFANVLTQCRPELAGLIDGDSTDWPERPWLMTEWATVLGSDQGPRHVLFAAGPGFGKTVAAAQFGLAATAEGWTVAGAFFRHGYTSLEDPLGVVEYVSGQLARLLPGFSDAREASRMESGAGNPVQVEVTGDIGVTATQVSGKVVGLAVQTPSGRPVDRAWRCDIADPLRALHRTGNLPRVLIVADALDETSAATRLMLADGLTLLPDHVRVLMTARPGTVLPVGDPVTSSSVARLQIDGSTPVAASDALERDTSAPQQEDALLIAAWASARLESAKSDHDWARRLATRIAEAAERIFLVAAYLTDDLVRRLAAGEVMPAANKVDLPTGGLGGVYEAFLRRAFGEDTTKWRTRGRPVLGSLSVARGAGLTSAIIGAASKLDRIDVEDTLADCQAFLTGESGARGATIWRIWHRSFAEHLHASESFPVRPWDWQLRLGTALLPAALEATASSILDSDVRHQYATVNAVAHLLDAADDPEGLTTESVRLALAALDGAGGWVEALVLLAGVGPAATQLERLRRDGPDTVPWHLVAEGIQEQAHVLNAPLTATDGFTLGQLSLQTARSRDAELSAAVDRWATMAPMLLARWSTAVSTGDVAMKHPARIGVMVATEVGGDQMCLIGGSDGWVRAWSPGTAQSAGAWRVPGQRRVTCLAGLTEISPAGEGTTTDTEVRTDDPTTLVVVGTPTGTFVLRWTSAGQVSVLWQAEDGPVTAALAVALDTDPDDPGNGPADRRLVLVTSHREKLRARDLLTGELAGHPPSLPMPVIALAELAVPGKGGGLSRQNVLASCLSDTGRSMVWDPRTDETVGDLMLGGPVVCATQAPDPTGGLLAVGLLDGTVKVGTLSPADGTMTFDSRAERNLGRTRKASSEAVTALAWTHAESELSLLVGDSAGRIHRLHPIGMARQGPWTAGHATSISALIPLTGKDTGRFLSAGSDGLVKAWQTADIDPAKWPDQVLTLEVMADPPAPATAICGHATGELSELHMDTGRLIERIHVHESPVWALTWAGPDFGLVSGDSRGTVVRSRREALPEEGGSWHSSELANLSGQIAGLSSGNLDGHTVVLASTLFSELVMLDQQGSRGHYPPFGGLPLTTRLATTYAGPCMIVEREVTDAQRAMTGESAGRQLHLISPIPQPGSDKLRPIWRLWWAEPEMLGAWDCAWRSPHPDGSGGHRPYLVAGLRDGAVLTLDLDRVLADPNLDLGHYQIHEAWPKRSPVTTLAAEVIHDRLLTAWTTDDGWLFVEHSWQHPPLRLQLGSRVLVTRIAPDGTIVLGGTDGVTAVRMR